MRRLIIISPHFPPTSAADHQRVRMALPHLVEAGYQVEVLAVHPDDVAAPLDPFLSETLPADVQVFRVAAPFTLGQRLFRLGSLARRCTEPIGKLLMERLVTAESDGANALVYFSTTQFGVHRIIPRIKARFSIPVAMDFQDPWATDYYRRHPKVVPPGGRLKFLLANLQARRDEQRVLGHIDGFTAVSSHYVAALRAVHSSVRAKPFLVLPFAAAENDFTALRLSGIRQTIFTPGDGRRHWIYVGRGGEDMHTAVSGLFMALRESRVSNPALHDVRIHFIGTDYATGRRSSPSIFPIAKKIGVSDQVMEYPSRIPYSLALRCLADADALIVPGSDDPSYTASKIYPYVLARKPMLTIFRKESPINDFLRGTSCSIAISFSSDDSLSTLAQAIRSAWMEPRSDRATPQTNWTAFVPFTAQAMTTRLLTFFNSLQSQ